MAVRAWTRLVATSFGAAAVIATAQFGVADGLGIIEWDSAVLTASDNAWRALLTWIVFLFAAAVLGGTAMARRWIRSMTSGVATMTARIVAALFAGLGAAVAFPLVWVSARALTGTAASSPEHTVAITAGAGIIAGVVLGMAGIATAPIGVSLAATVAWVWIFAITSAALALLVGAGPATPRLGMLDAPQIVSRADLWFSPFLMVVIAAVFGLAVAATGRWQRSHRLGVALSGFAGPALVATAYLVAGPGDAARMQPYLAALIATSVGLLTSTVVAATYPAQPGRTSVISPAAILARRAPLAISARPHVVYSLTESAGPEYGYPARPAIAAGPAPKPPAQSAPRALTAPPNPQGRPNPQSQPTQSQPTQSPPAPARVLVEPGSTEDQQLRKHEREHISWMQNLVNTPADPNLSRPQQS